jgi:hypothetical protein
MNEKKITKKCCQDAPFRVCAPARRHWAASAGESKQRIMQQPYRLETSTDAAARAAAEPFQTSAARYMCASSMQICFCSDGQHEANRSTARVFKRDADELRDRIGHAMQAGCNAAAPRFHVSLPGYGLGGSILEHVRSLLPLWRMALDGASSLPVAVPVYDHFAAAGGNRDAFLWAAFDDTLPCSSWYGCYWQELSRPCPDVAVRSMPRYPVVDHLTTAFGRKWGSLRTAAAVLHAWWRPTPELQAQLDRGVRSLFDGGHGSLRVSRDQEGGHGRHHGAGAAGECLALHIRRGDACATPWRQCPPLDDYLAAARGLARRHGLTTLFVATEDSEVLEQLQASTAAQREPWARVLWQEYDRRPTGSLSTRKSNSTRFWVEQRLRWARRHERPLGQRPVLEFLLDLEAASHCRALVGTMDSHGSQLMILRMAMRLGASPPFVSLVAPYCALTTPLPRGGGEEKFCRGHMLARDALGEQQLAALDCS